MNLHHRYLFHFFGTASYELFEDKLIYNYKNLKSESSWTYPCSKIKSFRNHKNGTDIWGFTSWIIVALIAISFLLKFTNIPPIFKLPISFVILILIFISFFFQFRKREYIGFYDKDDQFLFSIRIEKSAQTQDFICRIKDRIRKN